MTLSAYARDVINRARVNGYASDTSKAGDVLIRPFGEHDDQRASLRALQEATIGLCWVNSEGNLVPFDEAEFAGIQKEIVDLQGKIDNNSSVLEKLDAKVAELELTEFSINKLKGEIEKRRGQIAQIRAEESDSMRSKWESVVSLGGNRATYDKLPEVIDARAKAAEKIAPIESEIKALNGQIRSLESILSKFKR